MQKKRKFKLKISKKCRVLIFIVLSVFVVSCIIAIIFVKTKSLKIELNKDNKIEINSKLSNTDMITSIKNGKVISKKEMVDTSKLGKKTIKKLKAWS